MTNGLTVKGRLMYKIKGIHKLSELDDYEKGCTGEYQNFHIDIELSAGSMNELADKFKEFCCADEAEKNACDEPGRIDCQILENAEGYPLSKWEWERFKAGEIQAWAVTYTGYAKLITETEVAFY